MTAFLRRAGRGRLADGSILIWSVAEGRHGRRWRAHSTKDGSITHALLLEVGLDGRPARLELTTPGGMLTLHPESTGATLHGNVVTAEGMRHLAFGWGPDHELEVDGRPLASALTAHRLAGSTPAGEGRDVRVVAIAADLSIREGTRRFTRVSATDWRIEGNGEPRSLAVDERGIPLGLADAEEWPLERD